jgi:gluconate kinase
LFKIPRAIRPCSSERGILAFSRNAVPGKETATVIVFVAGLVGVGKSSVAKFLADRFSFYYYDVDEVKKMIYPQDPDFDHNMKHGIPFRKETRLRVYQEAVSDFQHLAEKHRHIIVDECLHLKELRQVLFDAAKVYFGGYVIVWVTADEAVIRKRLKKKARKGHILTDPFKMYHSFEKEFQGFDESHIVCNNNGSVEEATQSLLSLIQNLRSLEV